MYLYYNGKLVERETVKIEIEDRGYQFGDGVYEVIRVYGGKPFYLEDHLTRLERSAQEIQLDLDLSLNQLHEDLLRLVDRNQLGDGNIYIQVTRGVAPRAHAFPKQSDPVVIAYTISSPIPVQTQELGVSTITTEDLRWLRCDIKSLNLLGAVLAKQEAAKANCYEAILIRDQVVTEASAANVFFVQNGTLYTHPANNLILHGITRKIVLDLADQLEIPVVLEAIRADQIGEVDECFLTGTTVEVTPIVQVDGKPIGDGVPGPITRRLQEAYAQERVGERMTDANKKN